MKSNFLHFQSFIKLAVTQGWREHRQHAAAVVHHVFHYLIFSILQKITEKILFSKKVATCHFFFVTCQLSLRGTQVDCKAA